MVQNDLLRWSGVCTKLQIKPASFPSHDFLAAGEVLLACAASPEAALSRPYGLWGTSKGAQKASIVFGDHPVSNHTCDG